MRKNQKFNFAILLLSILLVPLSGTSFAATGQQTDPNADQSPSQSQAPSREHRQERARERFDQMSQQLNLTDDQKAKIQALMQNQAAQRQSLRHDASLSREDKMTKMRAMNQAARQEIDAVLTPEQRKMRKQMMKDMKGRGGDQPEQSPSGA